jgi:hypothetical protein
VGQLLTLEWHQHRDCWLYTGQDGPVRLHRYTTIYPYRVTGARAAEAATEVEGGGFDDVTGRVSLQTPNQGEAAVCSQQLVAVTCKKAWSYSSWLGCGPC